MLRRDLRSVRKEVGATGAPRLVVDGGQKESHADRFWAGALAAGAADRPIGPPEHESTGARDWMSDMNDYLGHPGRGGVTAGYA